MKAFSLDDYPNLLNEYIVFSLERLKNFRSSKIHPSGMDYTSLMNSFLLFNLSACQSLLTLANQFGKEWYPVAVGFIIDRTIFETLINARYISLEPTKRAEQYINYGKIISKNNLEAIYMHRETNDPAWKEIINYILLNELNDEKRKLINNDFDEVKSSYEYIRNGKKGYYDYWSGKRIREMAREVNHELEYDLFYKDLSSYTHVNVKLADQFLSCMYHRHYFNIESEYGK
jgi:hypothetical protein